jgi:hypothetical protein
VPANAEEKHTSAFVSIRQHTSAYVSSASARSSAAASACESQKIDLNE